MRIGWKGPCKCIFKLPLFPEVWYIFNLLFLNFLEHSIFNVILDQQRSSLECCVLFPIGMISLISYSMGNPMSFPVYLQIPWEVYWLLVIFWLWVQVLAPWALLVSFTSYLLKLFPLHLALILWFFAWQLPPKTFPQAVLFPVYAPHFWRFEVVKGGSYIATFQGPCLFLLWRLQIFSFPSSIPLILLGIIMTIILIIMTVNINRTYFVPGTSKALYTY